MASPTPTPAAIQESCVLQCAASESILPCSSTQPLLLSSPSLSPLPTDTADFICSPTILIAVGEGTSQQDFFVHETLLSARSEFFARLLQGPWKETNERRVSLPEDEPEVVKIWLKSLYTGSLETKQLNVAVEEVNAEQNPFIFPSKLYVLAEKLIDDTAKTAALRALRERATQVTITGALNCPSLEIVNTIYNGTPDPSPARQWLVDQFAHCLDQSTPFDFFPRSNSLQREFLADLVGSLISFRPLPATHKAIKVKIQSTETMLNNCKLVGAGRNLEIERLQARLTNAETAQKKLPEVERELKLLRNQVKLLKS